MAEEIKMVEDVPSESQMARARYLIGTGIGVGLAVPMTYIALGLATGDWNPFDGYDFSHEDVTPEPTGAATTAVEEATTPKVTTASVEDAPVADAAKAAAVAAPCGATEEVVETVKKVCALPEEALTATADSKCDGVISLTREALLQDTSYVTPEFVASIEDPLVKAVYQAILDGDRTALTTALTNLYTENGYFIPGNASGTLDGLKDSIIIYPGDQIVIDDEGWKLVRADGEVVKVVGCSGELLDVKDEAMSDTGKCGDTKVIPVSELPKEDVKPLCEDDCTKTPLDKAIATTAVETGTPFTIADSARGAVPPDVEAALRATERAVPVLVPTDQGPVPFLMSENPITPDDVRYAIENGYAVRDGNLIKLYVQPVNPQTGELMDPYCVEYTDANRDGIPDSPRPVEGQVYDTDKRVVFNSEKAGQKVRLPDGRVYTAIGVEQWTGEIATRGGVRLAR